MRVITFLILVLAIFFSACQRDEPNPYINYLRQFNESIKSLDIQNFYIHHLFEEHKNESPIKIRPYYEHIKLVRKQKNDVLRFLDSIISQTDTSLLVKILNYKSNNFADLNGTLKLEAVDLEMIKTKLFNYKNAIIPDFNNTENYKELQKSINGLFSKENLDNLNLFENKLNIVEFWSFIYKLKTDISVAESLILNFIYSVVEFDCFSFHKIEVMVEPNAQILPLGYPYKAEIFLSIIDTTISHTFEIEGKEYLAPACKGFYSFKATDKPGKYEKPGNFILVNPYDSTIQKIPFKIEYEVLEKK